MATQPDIRTYEVNARSSETFGRVLCNARNHHFVVDGPVQNGCPGEELTPAELFLSGVASCGVELVQVLARQQDVPLLAIQCRIEGIMDRGNPVRPDLTLFNTVRLSFQLHGVSEEQGRQLVDAFRGR